MISPMILVNSIYTLIDAFTASSNKVISHIFKDISKTGSIPINLKEDSLKTTEMWIYVLFISLLVVIVSLLMKAFVFYQKRD